MTLEELALEVLAERTLTQFESKNLVNWAVKVLELGYESDNLFILAGLDFDTTEEREAYFWKSLKDLNLEVEKSEAKLIEKYALTIANKAIRKEIPVEYAFSQMLKIVHASEYDYRYIAFYKIDEFLTYDYNNHPELFNSGLTLENSKDFILEELEIFVQMEALEIPEEKRNECYCETCKGLNTPILKNKYQLKKPFKYMAWTCPACGSKKLKFSGDHKVKRMIIEAFKKSNA